MEVRAIKFAIISLVFSFAANAQAAAQADELIPNQYIVILKKDNSKFSMAAAFATAQSVALESKVKPKKILTRAINGFAAKLDQAQLAHLKKDPRVAVVEQDRIVRLMSTQTAPTWGLDRIDQRALPLSNTYSYNNTGAGVTAYIIDSGINYTHQEFGGRAKFGFDAWGGDGVDCHGHGTHVAGTVGGASVGVAKGVTLVAVKVFACNATATMSGIIAGIEWVMNNRTGPSVANLSLGGGPSTALDTAVQNLVSSGVTAVVAAGNSDQNACNFSPARVSSAITVGATDSKDVRSWFSNYGYCIDWFAPGSDVYSAGYTSSSAYKYMSGTSMAAPHTAGVVALYLQSNPSASPTAIASALYNLSTKGIVATAYSPNNHLLNSQFGTVSPPAPSPTPYPTPTPTPTPYPTPTATPTPTPTPSIDTVKPTTQVTSPVAGARVKKGTTISITANAFDNVKVTKVLFYVNGTLTCTDTVSTPWSCAWKVPSTLFNKSYYFHSRAYDAAGNYATSSSVTVSSY